MQRTAETVAPAGARRLTDSAGFKLGSFLVDGGGRLTPRNPDATPSLRFQWRDCAMRALIKTDHRIVLQASPGRVPSTASGGPGRRASAIELLCALPAAVPAGWRLLVLANHGVVLESNAPLPSPPTATDLLTQVTLFLLALAPYLDLLAEEGTLEPMSGMAKVWPG